jgi:DNA-binding winged helix-turn-helix (wHTH) protein
MAVARSASGWYAFDRFRLSADGRMLLREDAVVPLAPKVLQTLLVLVQRAGEVVSKDDLIRAVWLDCFVEETGLTRNVSLLRQALDDDGRRFVVTVARVGYRFAADVQFERPVHPGQGVPSTMRGRVIVGRDRERLILLRAFERAASGLGGILAVAGEPGIGKTTVVEQALEELAGQCVVGRGRSSEQFAGAEAHLPILEALDELTRCPDASETLRRHAPTWARYMHPDVTADANEQPARNPVRLLRELTLFLDELSRDRTVVVFLDDMHWADSATTDVLAHLAPRLGWMRVLMVVTYRQNELAFADTPLVRLRGELLARGEMEEVAVSLLGLDDVSAYVRATSQHAEVSPNLSALVYRRSEGSPLFMTALLRFLEAGDRRFGSDVPDSLRGLIDRMLQRLDPAMHAVLTIGAVQGYEFDSATIAQATGNSAAEVEELLRAADHTHVLVARDRDSVLPNGTFTVLYRFVHVLYQSALLVSLAPSRRMTWARLVADALVASHPDRTDLIAGQLATLYEDGRDYGQAARYFLAASRNAARLFAFQDASQLADRGLRCLGLASGLDERSHVEQELALTFARLVPVSSLQGFGSQSVGGLTRRTVELAESLGDAGAMAHALLATSIVRIVHGECGAARDADLRLIALASESNDDVLLINAHLQAQIACHHLGEFHDAAHHADAVRRIGGHLAHRERCISIFDPCVASLAESARNLWITGHLGTCLTESERAVTLGREIGHPESLAFAWLFHAWLHGYRGDWQRCIRSADAGIATASEAGAVQTLAWNQCVHGWASAHVGCVDAGRQELSEGITASQAIMGEVAMPQFRAMMGEVLLLGGDVTGAARWIDEALTSGRSHDDRYVSAEVHRLAARSAALRRESERALAFLHTSLAIAREQGARTFELRAALALHELCGAQGTRAIECALDALPEPEPWPEVVVARSILASAPP